MDGFEQKEIIGRIGLIADTVKGAGGTALRRPLLGR